MSKVKIVIEGIFAKRFKVNREFTNEEVNDFAQLITVNGASEANRAEEIANILGITYNENELDFFNNIKLTHIQEKEINIRDMKKAIRKSQP